jgi:hypothetical protein
MAQCDNCTNVEVIYDGNGRQEFYSFPFKYIEQSDIRVAAWEPELREWRDVPSAGNWKIATVTQIQFNTPPRYRFKIYRCTDVDPRAATFYPGYPIKADDLNDNFEQLAFAIEEASCIAEHAKDYVETTGKYWLNRVDADEFIEELGIPGDMVKSYSRLTIDDEHVASTEWIDNRYWDQCEETTYMADDWDAEADDDHVPTTGAVKKYVDGENFVKDKEIVTQRMQDTGKWDKLVSDDDHLATTAALVNRHDTRLADLGNTITETKASLDPTKYVQPGKFWVDTNTIRLFYQDPSQNWVQINTMGDAGIQGPEGPQGPPGLSGHIGDEPPTDKYPGQLWFNTKCPSGLYVWDGTQWIGVSLPGPQGPKGDTGSGMDAADLTAQAPIVATINVAAQTAELSMNIDLLPPI